MVYSFPIFQLNRNNGGILTKLGVDIVYDVMCF